VITIHQRYRQTDRQTDRRHAIAIPRFALNGAEVTSDKEKAELFNKFFSSVYVKEDVLHMPDKLESSGIQFLENVEFNEDDVLQLLMKLNVRISLLDLTMSILVY